MKKVCLPAMKILIVAATIAEIESMKMNINSGQVRFLVTGAGIVSTAYTLTKLLAKEKFDLVVNAGIAGSFSEKFPLGSVVHVTEDCFADSGAEDDERFIHISEMGFEGDEFPFRKKFIKNKVAFKNEALMQLPEVSGITVNKVHGNEESISKVKSLFNPDVETMEGAAVMYVCMKEKIPCIQVRGISNYVEKRDKSKWNIQAAIKNSCEKIHSIIQDHIML